jgi:hypothetical protein
MTQGEMMMSKNMIGRLVGNFYVGVHTKHPPDQNEWELMFSDMGQGKPRGALFHTDGGAPSAFQRKQLRDFVVTYPHPLKGAILTDSVIARMAITAINLFTKGLSTPFAPYEIDAALTHLGVPKELWPEMKRVLAELKKELGIGVVPLRAR